MVIRVNENISKDSWRNIIHKCKFASPFQTFEFYKIFNSVSGFSAIAIGIENSGSLIALVVVTLHKEKGIKGYFSKRAIIYGGPLILEGHDKSLPILFKELNSQLKDKAIYIEIRNYNDYSKYKKLFIEYGWIYQPYLNFQLNCSSREIVWSQFSNNRKRQINKAINKGVYIKESTSLNEVKEFYKILYELYIKKIKKPLPSVKFFEAFYNKTIGKLFLIYFNEKIVGGSMCVVLPGRIIYEFYKCGLDQDYKHVYPSVMATYAGIEYGYNNGLQYFDFMGAGKPDEHYGVREFKKEFGGELVEHGRFIKIYNNILYNIGKILLRINKLIN